MSDGPVRLSPPGPPPAGGRVYKPILITILCAVLLAAGSCYGFLNTMTSVTWYSKALAAVFLVSALVFAVALVWLLVAFVINVTSSDRG